MIHYSLFIFFFPLFETKFFIERNHAVFLCHWKIKEINTVMMMSFAMHFSFATEKPNGVEFIMHFSLAFEKQM